MYVFLGCQSSSDTSFSGIVSLANPHNSAPKVWQLSTGDHRNRQLSVFFKALSEAAQGLSFYTTNEQLKKLFSPFGAVTEARLVRDPKTQRPKGFGFVTFDSEVEARNALKALNGRIVDGRLIFVEVARSMQHGEDATS
ncbi:uncharacterized protein LOC107427791 isoform X1 [Ziziphus jujuba]|uniref:Uncharacterized protein LOC107427791 isoform X1 n=1 Tax=Ziziphus jujuba TaxID=326968 RepID=A0ABM3ZSK0_ZIZJJ|nr:uncharacterized protein LOC107427791 isoform X1 [Ziziphus jujuba]